MTSRESPTRALSPTFSLYNAIASGAVSTRSISPSLSMSSSHQPLLTPLLHAISLLNRAISGRRQAHYQPSTACVISCVRSLLMSTECLHRDAPVLKRVPPLASERKVILGNLATLVAQARRCSEWPGVDDDGADETWQASVRQAELEQQDWELEQMIRMGGEVLRNVTRFLEVCEENGVELPVPRRTYSSGSDVEIQQRIKEDLGVAGQSPQAQQTPHRRAASSFTAHTTPALATTTTTPNRPGVPQLSALRTKSLNDLRARRRIQHLERSKQTAPQPSHTTPLTSSLSSMSSFSSHPSSQAHQTPLSIPTGPLTPAQLLSFLRSSNDALLSAIAAFIGHVHSYNRSVHASNKGHLIELARETVDMVRRLLGIVEAVVRHPDVSSSGGRGEALVEAKAALFECTNELVEAVRVLTSPSPPALPSSSTSNSLGSTSSNAEQEEKERTEEEEKERWRTLQGATNVLKVGGDCVAAVKVCLSRPIGTAMFVVTFPGSYTSASTSTNNAVASSSNASTSYGSNNPNAAAASMASGRVSYLRRRSASVSSVTKGGEVIRDVSVSLTGDEDLTIQAVDVSSDSREIRTSMEEHEHEQEAYAYEGQEEAYEGLEDVDEGDEMGDLAEEEEEPPTSAAPSLSTSASTLESVESVESEDDEGGRASERSSMGETTPATSVMPEEKDIPHTHTLPLRFSQKLLHGSLPVPPPPSPFPPTHPNSHALSPSSVPPTPDSPNPPAPPPHSPLPTSSTTTHPHPGLPHSATYPAPSSANLGEYDPHALSLTHDYDPRDIAYNSDGAIVGATLDVMVEKMTPHDALVDPAFQHIFMLTFRLFSSPKEFVGALVARYNLSPPSHLSRGSEAEGKDGELEVWMKRKATPVKLRVANLVKTWVESWWRAEVDNVVLDVLSAFVKDVVGAEFPGPAARILELIRTRTSTASNSSSNTSAPNATQAHHIPTSPHPLNPLQPQMHIPVSPSEIPRPVITKTLFGVLKRREYASVNVVDFDALELARQFTIMENKLYLDVRVEEVLELGLGSSSTSTSGSASAREGKERISGVKAISRLSTAITGWVTECILNEEDAKRRTGLVKFFIKVADRCSTLSNYSTSRSILAALDSATISRLHQTLASLPAKQKTQLATLRKIADHARNYSEYRSRLRNTSPPAVPFMGLYLTDITFCREGNPSYRASPRDPARQLINFNKYHKMARIVQDMQRFQVGYGLKEIGEVQGYLLGVLEGVGVRNGGDLGDLYRRSLLVEPRRAADAPISASDGKSMLQIWGLGTLTRNQGLAVPKPNAA
ncbi:hypothetical protein M422DRAFT_24504 [Sphaerobolus stellatus SS14]|nr:hypothetical protein M422DRAFT_24504 [Sphaerobolus stellatus SS14]